MYLNEDFKVNAAKALFISKLSEILGWDSLHFDTYPESKFNIWHFPEECRNNPGTKKEYQRNRISYITKDEFDAFKASYE